MQLRIFYLFVLFSTVYCQSSPKPNIVVILADDLGWHNVGYHNDEIISPALNELKQEGVELLRHYTYKVCSPTRSALMSGRLPIHVNERNSGNTVPNGGVPRKMTTISRKLKDVGYSTHFYGKWHIGMAYPDVTPTGRGFDTSIGYFSGAVDHYTQKASSRECGETFVDFWKTNEPAYGLNGTYSEYTFTNAAIDTINSHDPKAPLFMYIAFQNPHSPLQVPQEYIDRYPNPPVNDRRKYYQAMTTFLDEAVGNITDTLKEKGLWENTLLVFSADNGGPTNKAEWGSPLDGGGNNYPLKGSKGSDWEGGVRATAFVSGGFLPEAVQGTEQQGLIHICDWYATFCHLSGADPIDHDGNEAGLPPVDSLNMWPLISGQTDLSPRKEIPLSSVATRGGGAPTHVNLISGDYKILLSNMGYAGWTGPTYPNSTEIYLERTDSQDCSSGCLYNIFKDPNEYNDLAETLPNVHAGLISRSREIARDVFVVEYEPADPRACNAALDYGGYWGPFIDVDVVLSE